MDTKALYYFQAVYEEGNIHTAAKKRFISPQGLGKIIKGLEAELGGLLLSEQKAVWFPPKAENISMRKAEKFCRKFRR